MRIILVYLTLTGLLLAFVQAFANESQLNKERERNRIPAAQYFASH